MEEIKLDEFTEDFLKLLLLINPDGERHLNVRKQLKNSFFRVSIYEKYNHQCCEPKCSKKKLDKNNRKIGLSIHHKEYSWECLNDTNLQKEFDCKSCCYDNPKQFARCIEKCELLCGRCHYIKHNELKKTVGNWLGENCNGSKSIIKDYYNYAKTKEKQQNFHKHIFQELIKKIPHQLKKEKNPNTHKRWTQEGGDTLKQLFLEKKSAKEISKILGRSNKVISSKLYRLHIEELRKKHPNAYNRWTQEEKDTVKKLFLENKTVKDISEILGRQESSIHSTLIKLGLIKE